MFLFEIDHQFVILDSVKNHKTWIYYIGFGYFIIYYFVIFFSIFLTHVLC